MRFALGPSRQSRLSRQSRQSRLARPATFAMTVLGSLSALLALSPTACGVGDFDPSTKVSTVRLLASRVNGDKAYAKPGDDVELEVLAFDGREQKPRPMQIYWIPFPCVNPRGDLYYACFVDTGAASGGAGSGGGASGASGALGQLQPGVDLSPFLPTGPKYSVKVPADIIDKHRPVQGAVDPYGLVIVFNVACAGHVEIVAVDPAAGPQAVPLGCFDEAHNRLPPSDYVIGFTRVYAYASRTNANPVIDNVTVDGAPIKKDGPVPYELPPCVPGCPQVKLNVQVPETSQELNPGDVDPDGQTRKELLWVDYFTTDGALDGEARLLYDPTRGKVTSDEPFSFPSTAKDGFVWVVVHDNRDGVDWLQIPFHVR